MCSKWSGSIYLMSPFQVSTTAPPVVPCVLMAGRVWISIWVTCVTVRQDTPARDVKQVGGYKHFDWCTLYVVQIIYDNATFLTSEVFERIQHRAFSSYVGSELLIFNSVGLVLLICVPSCVIWCPAGWFELSAAPRDHITLLGIKLHKSSEHISLQTHVMVILHHN